MGKHICLNCEKSIEEIDWKLSDCKNYKEELKRTEHFCCLECLMRWIEGELNGSN